jgi:hypothetical protein
MRAGPFTGGAVLLPWDAIDMRTRRRLIAARPIAAERRRAQTFAMFAVAAACGFALVLISGFGFGRVDEAWLVEQPWMLVPYALLVAGIVVPSVWLARRVLSAGAWFPYERALLQLDAIERTPSGLVVRPFGDARHAVIEHGVVEVQYVDGSTFRVRTNVPPDVMNVALGAAEDILSRASLSDDHTHRDAIDPFTSLRDDRGFTPRARTTKLAGERASGDRSKWTTAALAIASVAVAFPLFALRNQSSDDAAFAFARGENVRGHYESYLASGATRHAREVKEELLPRLVLDDAERHSSPDELVKYLERFPRSRFDAEAHAALTSTCVLAATPYASSSKHLFGDIDDFLSEKQPPCATERAAVSARFFDTRRRAVETDLGIEESMRHVLVTLLDRAEAKHERIPFHVVTRGTVDAVLADQLSMLAGKVLATDGPPHDEDARLEIATTPLACARAGQSPLPVVASFSLWVDGSRRGQWHRNTLDNELFEAITTPDRVPAASEVCRRPHTYDFRDMHPWPLAHDDYGLPFKP